MELYRTPTRLLALFRKRSRICAFRFSLFTPAISASDTAPGIGGQLLESSEGASPVYGRGALKSSMVALELCFSMAFTRAFARD
jgi:hypothetical protein